MAKTPAAKTTTTSAKGKATTSATGTGGKAFAIDTDLVRAIAELLTETNVGEIEVSKGDLKVRVARHGPVAMAAPMMTHVAPAAHAPSPGPAVAPERPTIAKPADAAAHPGAVKSPMVGTAYRKPSPEAQNFVEIGSAVKAGQKLMLIEAMKTFNDITAAVSGTVTAIFIDDGQPVEFGQVLFVIE